MPETLTEKYQTFQKRLKALNDQAIRLETQREQAQQQATLIQEEVVKAVGEASMERLDTEIANVYNELETLLKEADPLLSEAEHARDSG